MYCRSCGRKGIEGNLFCTNCGALLEPSQHDPKPESRPRETRGRRTWIVLAIPLVLTAVIAGIIIGVLAPGGEQDAALAPTSEPTAAATKGPIAVESEIGVEGSLPAPQAQMGDTVSVHYTGTLEDGSEFDSSVGGEPLQFTVGDGNVIAGFDQAVRGLAVGEKRRVVIPPEDAYGDYRDDLVFERNPADFPPDIDPQVGQQLQSVQPDGGVMIVTVIAVSETTVTLDGNHRLAGKDLIFDITLVDIR